MDVVGIDNGMRNKAGQFLKQRKKLLFGGQSDDIGTSDTLVSPDSRKHPDLLSAAPNELLESRPDSLGAHSRSCRRYRCLGRLVTPTPSSPLPIDQHVRQHRPEGTRQSAQGPCALGLPDEKPAVALDRAV